MRQEFSKAVKREALLRSDGLCEAVGPLYGLSADVRCNVSLSRGIHFDHVNPDGNGGEPTLENCAAVCPTCHAYKTKHDVARIAKMKRQRDKHQGIRAAKKKIPSRGFSQFVSNTKQLIEGYE